MGIKSERILNKHETQLVGFTVDDNTIVFSPLVHPKRGGGFLTIDKKHNVVTNLNLDNNAIFHAFETALQASV